MSSKVRYVSFNNKIYKIKSDELDAFLKASSKKLSSFSQYLERINLRFHILQDAVWVNFLRKKNWPTRKIYSAIRKILCILIKKYCILPRCRVITDAACLDVQLYEEGVKGYNILQTKGRFIAIKQGYPFDVERWDYNEYPPEVLFVAATVKEVVTKVNTAMEE